MSVINIGDCKKCTLGNRPQYTNIVLGVGNPNADIMIIGAAPEKNEALQGTPFIGLSGEVLDQLLELANIKREDVYITNVCKCWPWKVREGKDRTLPSNPSHSSKKDNDDFGDMFATLSPNYIKQDKSENVIDYQDKINKAPESEEIRECRNYLIEEIRLVNPKVIIPLGATALHALTNKKEKITDRRGIPTLYGKPGSSSLYNKDRIYILPTLQPSYILSNGGVKLKDGSLTIIGKEVLSDLNYAKTLIQDKQLFKEHRYLLVDSREKVDKVIAGIKKRKVMSFDIETTGLEIFDKILGIGICVDVAQAAYFPFLVPEVMDKKLTPFWDNKDISKEEVVNKLREVFEDPSIKKSAHNSKFDMRGLRKDLKIEVKGLFWDSMCGAYLINENIGHDLDTLKNQYVDLLGYSDRWYSETKGGKKSYLASLETISNYCCGDCDATYRLTKDQIKVSRKDRFISWFMEHFYVPVMEFVTDFEYFGIKYDKETAFKLSEKFKKKEKDLLKKILEYANCGEFNPNSDKDLIKVLQLLGLHHPKRTGKTQQQSVDKEVLEDLSEQHIVPKLILERRHLEKMRSTYMEKYVLKANKDPESRVHISLNPIGAKTGRPSSKGLMNVPKESTVKNLFIPEKGCLFVQGDLSQAEVRCFAHYANEDILRQAFAVEGVDIHSMAAAEIAKIPYEEFVEKVALKDPYTTKLRSGAKSVIFGILYGRGAASIAKQNGWTLEEAEAFIANFFEKFPMCKEFIDATHKLVNKTGEVSNIFGRIRRLPSIFSKDNEVIARTKRQAVNSIIQSTASDITFFALIKIHKHLKKEAIPAKIVLTVYDSIIVETREDLAHYVSEYMQKTMECLPHPEFTVKLKSDIEIFSKWGEEVKIET